MRKRLCKKHFDSVFIGVRAIMSVRRCKKNQAEPIYFQINNRLPDVQSDIYIM